MSEELKPCPFCGSTDIETFYNKTGVDHLTCQYCGATAKDWNTRHEPDYLIRTVKTRINELEEQIEENCTYRSRELVNHEIVVLKWALTLRKPEIE